MPEQRGPTLAGGVGLAQFERALRYPSQRLLVIRFCAGLAVSLILLIALGYVIGHGPSGGRDSFAHALTAAIGKAGVSVAIAVPLIVLATWCLRRLWLEGLAWSPGTIQVPEFACTKELLEELADATPAQLTTQFRNTLATLRLRADSPSPGAPPPSDFLDVLSKDSALQGTTASVSIAQVAALLRAAFPPSALEVRGTLVARKDAAGRCCGVSLQVVRQPKGGSKLSDVWDKTWEDAIRRAADAAIAAILPRTRRCKGPWITWRGYVMDPVVLGAYEDAARFDSERHYYAALKCSYRALERDPLNRALRLQLGKLQEQLGLYLEALGTYQSIREAAQPAGGKLHRRLYKRRARYERRRQADIARYRQIVLLGGDSIVKQWIEVRRRAVSDDAYLGEMESLLRQFCRAQLDLRACDETTLGRTLCEAGLAASKELERALRKWRFTHPELRAHLLTRTVAVAGAGLDQRLAELKRATADPPEPAPAIGERLRLIDAQLEDCAGRTGLKTYQSHYNAACLYALPLKVDYLSESAADLEAKDRLAERAVGQLQIAASFADSAFLATRRHWLVVEDPDLDGLRKHPAFASFVSTYFPTPSTVRRRWAGTQELAALYTYELLRCIAPMPTAGWNQRSATAHDTREDDQLSRWWHRDGALWTLVSSIAANPTNWRSHLAMLDAIDRLDDRFAVPPFHRFAADESENKRVQQRLSELGTLLSSAGAALLAPSDRAFDRKIVWLAENAASLSTSDLQAACSRRAEPWSRMNALLGAHDDNAPTLVDSMSRAIAEVAAIEINWG